MKFDRPRLLFAKYAELLEEDHEHPRLSQVQKELEALGYEIEIVDDEEPPFLEDGEEETVRDPHTNKLLRRQCANMFLRRIGNKEWREVLPIEYWTPVENIGVTPPQSEKDATSETLTSSDRAFLAGKISWQQPPHGDCFIFLGR